MIILKIYSFEIYYWIENQLFRTCTINLVQTNDFIMIFLKVLHIESIWSLVFIFNTSNVPSMVLYTEVVRWQMSTLRNGTITQLVILQWLAALPANSVDTLVQLRYKIDFCGGVLCGDFFLIRVPLDKFTFRIWNESFGRVVSCT